MTNKTIEKEFLSMVGAKIKLVEEGNNRYRVLTPFQFDDGDQLVIVLKKERE